jgi:hypothetical protein
MFLECDGTSNTFRSPLCGEFSSHSFETLAAARLIGLRLGAKMDGPIWRNSATLSPVRREMI